MGCWLYDHLRTRSNCICSQKNIRDLEVKYTVALSPRKPNLERSFFQNGRPESVEVEKSTQGKPWNHEAPQRPGQGIQTHTSLQLSDQSPSGWQIDSILVDANGKLGIWFLGASRVTTRNVPNFEITSNCHRIVAFEGSSSRMNSQRNLRI